MSSRRNLRGIFVVETGEKNQKSEPITGIKSVNLFKQVRMNFEADELKKLLPYVVILDIANSLSFLFRKQFKGRFDLSD